MNEAAAREASFSEFEDEASHVSHLILMAGFRQCFRIAFDTCNVDNKRTLVAKYADILRKQPEFERSTYELQCFSCRDLQYATPTDAELIKDHVLRLLNERGASIALADGVGKFVTSNDAQSGKIDFIFLLSEDYLALTVVSGLCSNVLEDAKARGERLLLACNFGPKSTESIQKGLALIDGLKS